MQLHDTGTCSSFKIKFHTYNIEREPIAGTRSTYQITTCTHRTNCAISMSLGHLSILLTHYGAFYMHVYRGHAAGAKSQPTQTIKHSRGNMSQGLVAAVNYCLVHTRRAVAIASIGRTRQGQHQIAHIHSQMQPLHVPET